ncbi:MAG: hypothetical protein VX498_15580 [Myxococcota bacterium]|nr:hypothetical protein [Myxococcota bacterium]
MNTLETFLYVHGPDLAEGAVFLAVFLPLFVLLNYFVILSYRAYRRLGGALLRVLEQGLE